jgi:peptidoglycan/xylan/chitin deacetylase (PgdA/CDA1 family)
MGRFIFLLAIVVLISNQAASAAPGDTRICKWKDNKVAAFSVGGDDSLRSQTTFAIPLMTQRGIYGTWWVNTGRGHNELGFDFIDDQAYWVAAVKAGHDLASHTLRHTGARDAADADWEIGENARRIWAIQSETKILLFERGGGTVWDVSEDTIKQTLLKYQCLETRGAPAVDHPTWLINHTAAELRSYVDAAIKDGGYHTLIFHGIGPNAEWGGQKDGDAFVALLDYLYEKRDLIWSNTFTKVYKYVEERDKSTVSIKEASADKIRLALTSSLDTSKGMYDYPITLRTEVPSTWKTCTVTQGEKSVAYPVESAVVQFSAIPNAGDITIVSGGQPLPLPTRTNTLPPAPSSPPAPAVLPTRLIDDFSYDSDAQLNSAWWVIPCGNETTISVLREINNSRKTGMNFSYTAAKAGTAGRLRRNTSLDLSPYRYVTIWVKPSGTGQTITFQFMEAIQSEFWESSFTLKSADGQTIGLPLTKEYFHHPAWFHGAETDNVIDLSNIKLISLYVSGDKAGAVAFRDVKAVKTMPPSAYIPGSAIAVTPPLTETGRCASPK